MYTTDKCLVPYYGGCPLSRECLSSEFDVNCGACLNGFITDPTDPGGPCLRKNLCNTVKPSAHAEHAQNGDSVHSVFMCLCVCVCVCVSFIAYARAIR